ncbi:MAG TPA: two-component regulator propeller domain-containing protein, partial [Bacteroidota bacterium]
MGTSTAGPQFYRPHFCVLAMLVVAVLLVVHSAEAFQQARRPLRQYVHDFWTVKEGLPQNAAYVIMQSRDGYIWFGTQEGLVRFDGLEFKVFDRANNPDMQNGWV